MEGTVDTEKTLDADHTLDSPVPSEVTQTMHFTPPPSRLNDVSMGRRSETSAAQSTGGENSRRRFGESVNPHTTSGTGPAAATAFTIVRQHARGGLGVVSLARDEHIKREVALKQILPQHIDNSVLKRRFLYEAQITGQLEHPSIVPVYCLGSDDAGNPYYVMRFVKGRTLDEIIREHHSSPNPIVFRELLRRFIAVCQAVAYAHSRGVIHRDLKPANVMLGDYGETLVLDWGLAKDIKQGGVDPALWVAEPEPASKGTSSITPPPRSTASVSGSSSQNSAELTMQGQIIGTPAYMAPEQAEGRTDAHGPVTDVYALGGILYKILTGHSPQAPTGGGTGITGQRKFTFVASPPPSSVAKDVEPLLEKICLHAMQTDPQARYPRALEMAQEIQRWLDEHPLVVKPHTSLGKLRAGLRDHFSWILAALLVIILGLLVVIALMRGR